LKRKNGEADRMRMMAAIGWLLFLSVQILAFGVAPSVAAPKAEP
jgi:hypothetical protein